MEGQDLEDAFKALKGHLFNDPDRGAKLFLAIMSVIKRSLLVSPA